jgi:CheY-like chemotaxis protein
MPTVLTIEHNPLIRENLLKILTFNGFEAIAAENGLIGLEKARSCRPDLILSDVLMPELTGYDVFQALRRMPETHNIPIIFLTTKATAADIQYVQSLNVDGYLIKPFRMRDLVSLIADCLSSCRQSSHSLSGYSTSFATELAIA